MIKAGEIRGMTQEEILDRIKELEGALFNLKFQRGAGQLENVMKITENKRDLARLKTILTEKAKGPGGA
jgi:large subunit ribosomal protein L29